MDCYTAIKNIHEEFTGIGVNAYAFMLGEVSEYKLKYTA